MCAKILMVAGCNRRGNGPVAYIGDLISYLKKNKRCQVDLFVSSMSSNCKVGDFQSDNLFIPEFKGVLAYVRKIPRVRVWGWKYLLLKYYKSVVEFGNYDYVVFHSIPSDISKLVRLTKQTNAKILLFPWGSEILRASNKQLKRYKYAFENADYIRGDSPMLKEKIKSTYKVLRAGFPNVTYGSKVLTLIKKNQKQYTRQELAQKIGLPESSYYIVCGYNAYEGQCHEEIIRQLALAKSFLPQNYLLVFPYTYGDGPDPIQLQTLCKSNGLRAEFLVDYLSDVQVACLHLLTDLLIHVQKTDLASSYLTEAIYSGTNIINGEWLKYTRLQQYGDPYYLTPKITSLHKTLTAFFCGDLPNISIDKRLRELIEKDCWDNAIEGWLNLFI